MKDECTKTVGIVRAPQEPQFATFNMSTVNMRIAPELLGVYLHLLSKPAHWVTNGVYLCRHFGMSKNRCYRILNDLSETVVNGTRLVEKQTTRDDNGQYSTTYLVSEPHPSSPQNEERHRSSFTGTVNEDVVNIELSTTTADWRPPKVVEDQLKVMGLTYTDADLAHFRVSMAEDPKIQKKPGMWFITWLKRERAEGWKRGEGKSRKAASAGPTARELLENTDW